MPTNSACYTGDVAIIGGGLIGIATALALTRHPLYKRVIIIERQPWQTPTDGGKALALNIASHTILTQLGVWSHLESPYPIRSVLVSEQGRWGQLSLPCQLLDCSALGYLVAESELKNALFKRTQQCSQIQWLRPFEVAQITQNQGLWQIEFNDSEQSLCQTNGLIAADGQKSWVRSHLGFAYESVDLDEQAVIGRLHLAQPHYGQAHERVTSHGVLALLPTGPCSYDWVLTGSDKHIAAWHNWCEIDGEIGAMTALTNHRLGMIEQMTQHGSYPLSWLTMPKQVGEGIVFLGNAAHSIHPIAGQGLNLSLRDMAALVNTAIKMQPYNEPLLGEAVLNHYQKQRQIRQKPILWVTRGLHKWLAQQKGWRRFARPWGLSAIDIMPGVKKRIMRQLAGLDDHRRLLGGEPG